MDELATLLSDEVILNDLKLRNIFKVKPELATDFQKAKAEALIRARRTRAGDLAEPAGVDAWRKSLGL